MSDRKLPLDRSERILNELLKIPVNTICCDCGEANPKWASFNLGCFLCVRCCSVHRKMGTHISKVKSVSLDAWTQDDIDTMKNWGNGKVNAMYMPHPERHPPPTSREGSAMEQYIRSKYERKEFMEGGGNYQPSNRSAYGNTFSGGRGSGHANDIVNTQSYTTQISALRAMGFTDHTKNLQVLQSTNGDVPNAIEILCRIGSGPVTSSINLTSSNSNRNNSPPARSQSSRPTNTSSDPKETILWNMGFHDSAMNKEALRRAGGNPEVAAGILIDDKDKLAKAVRDKSGSSPLPARLDPPGNNRSQSHQNDNNLLLDLSTPDDNTQQQQRQQFMMQQQMMNQNQNQNQNPGIDQFGQNHNQLQSILDKNASILALYNNDTNNNNNMNGMDNMNMNNNMNMFGNNMNAFQQQPTGLSSDMSSWSMNSNMNNNMNNNMHNNMNNNMNNNNFNSAFGLQTSMATGTNNMFGNNANAMGASSPNPFGLQQSVSQSDVGFNNNNNAFGNLATSSAMTGNSNNMFGGNTGMGGSSPMSSPFGTMNSSMGSNVNTNMNLNNNNAFGTNQGMSMGMNTMGTMGTMGNMGNMGNMNNNNNNNFNSAFGMNHNNANHGNNNPWGNNNNNNNNNFF